MFSKGLAQQSVSKSVLQGFPTRASETPAGVLQQECLTRVPHKSAPKRVSNQSVTQESILQESFHTCLTRVCHKSAPQECFARVFQKSVLLVEEYLHKSVEQKWSYKSTTEKCHPRMSVLDGATQECQTTFGHLCWGACVHSGSWVLSGVLFCLLAAIDALCMHVWMM